MIVIKKEMHTTHTRPQNQIFFFFYNLELQHRDTWYGPVMWYPLSQHTGSELSAACSPSEINTAVCYGVSVHIWSILE